MKSFMVRIFHYFTFLYTAERDVCVSVNFKLSGGPAPPGPSDATPMHTVLFFACTFYSAVLGYPKGPSSKH